MTSSSLIERVKQHPLIAGMILIAAILAGTFVFRDNLARLILEADHSYHGRNAATALIQFAPMSPRGRGGALQYMATFENRSSDPLVITDMLYELHGQPTMMAAASEVPAAGNASMGAAPLESAHIYDAETDCAAAGRQALVPTFQVPPHSTGAFKIRLKAHVSNDRQRDCDIEVRFVTNQGSTNGIVQNVTAGR